MSESSPLLTDASINKTYDQDQDIGLSGVVDDTVDPFAKDNWEFAGWGTVSRMNLSGRTSMRDTGSEASDIEYASRIVHDHKQLGQLRATAIAGNDITSSCLYVAGIAAQSSGKFTPISLFIVVIVLYFFRSIYTEVGTALPLNGGSYNVLLNSTTKLMAALAACLSIISYVATAVVSASSAVSYLGNLYSPLGAMWMVIVVLGIFAVLNIFGISESANVAAAIFVLHIATLTLLVVISAIKMFGDLSILTDNWKTPGNMNFAADIYFGYASALLGVTGFETSSNYIEEQKDGVFPKTLRNMWILVAIFNPVLSLLSLGVLPMEEILKNQASLLAWMAQRAGGAWLNYVVCIDATLVLSGAVLTAYVGVTGLVKRMALDRCMPQFLLNENKWRKTNHWIIIGFFLITSSLYLIVNGNILYLGGVYTIAFLGVMSLFAIGNMLLKYKRSRLPRQSRASWPSVLFGLLAIWAGLIGNVVYNLEYLAYFAIYFSVTMTIVSIMFGRIRLLRVGLYFLKKSPLGKSATNWAQKQVKEINSHPIIFFSKTDDLPILAKAVEYVRDNESCNWLKIVHVYQDESTIPKDLEVHVRFMDKMYPKLRIDLLLVKGTFGPAVVDRLSEEIHVPKNYMFITTPGSSFPHNMGEFGGVRLVTH